MQKATRSHTIDVVFVLAVACAFAASILMVLMLGVNVYGNIQKTSDAQFNERVCLSYVTAKVHRNDTAGAVRTGDFEGVSALYLDQEIDGTYYNTLIYAYDGWLMELFCEKDSMTDLGLSPESGSPVLEVDSIVFKTVAPNLLFVEYSDNGGVGGSVFINLRSEGGDGG
jgi:hypothetical protein